MYPQASHGSNRILHLGTESSSQLYKSLSKQPLGHNKAKSEGGGRRAVSSLGGRGEVGRVVIGPGNKEHLQKEVSGCEVGTGISEGEG